MAMVASRRRLPLAVTAGAVLLVATAAWWHATPAHADDVTVIVESTDDGGRYAPDEVTIELGDTITWVWETNGHSVTHEPEDGQDPAFDSHPNSGEDPGLCPPFCGAEGETYAVSDFPAPGRYAYTSKMDPRMRGVVVVTEAAPQSIERTSTSDAPTAGAPSMARDDASPSPVPDPSFEDFPSASEPTGDAEVGGEVALGGPDDGSSTARTVWAVVGGVSVLGTLGAFGRTVLFADVWNA